jgi:hypothetical protein
MDSMITSQQEIQVYLLFCRGFKIGHVVLSYGKMGISVLFCSVLAACALAVTQFQISTSSTIIAACITNNGPSFWGMISSPQIV